ncbi:MAG: phosphoadenylyl-sulfate reductase, partial [Acidimicrobiales bacterium]
MTIPATNELIAELEAVDRSLEHQSASAAIDWALERFVGSVVVACSFQDAVIVELVVERDPSIEVVFLDTGAHFEETLEMVRTCRARYDLNLTVTTPSREAEGSPCGSDRCCELRKVEPLRRALEGRAAWITGLKRCDSPSRASIPIVSFDHSFGLVKVNPMATWTEADVAGYEGDRGLPVHPLMAKGYRSIGCAPTTRAVSDAEQSRAGRWAGTDKTEC